MIDRPVEVPAPTHALDAARLRHPGHDDTPYLDGREPHPIGLSREDLFDRVFEILV
jgi:hypothetical protein